MDISGGGGGGLPTSFTINSGPWAGVYDRPQANNDGSTSFYGPTEQELNQTVTGAWSQQFPLPALHFTVHPGGSIHASLDMGGKNAHLHWNGGSPQWDLNALDDAKYNLLTVIESNHPGAVNAALQSAATQLSTGVTPAFVPTTSPTSTAPSHSAGNLASEEEYPSLVPSGPKPSVTTPVHQEPEYQQPEYQEPQYAQAEYDQSGDEGYQHAAVEDDDEDLSFLNVGPNDNFNPSANPPAQAYLDEADQTTLTFAVDDGRSLSIDRATLEGAVDGSIPVPMAMDWVTFDWMGSPVDLPASMFTETKPAG